MFVVRLALNTLVLPVVPVVLFVVVAYVTRSTVVRRAAVLAAGSGIVVAHLVDVGVPRLPPIDTIGWIPFAIAFLSLALLRDVPRIERLIITFCVATVATRLVGRPIWPSLLDAAPWALLAGGVATLADASLDVASGAMPAAAPLLGFAMTMASGSIACLFGHSALLAQVLGASAAVTGACGVVAIFVEPAKAVASVVVVSTVTVLVYARLYATLPLVVVALLMASAAAPVIASSLPISRRARAVVAVAAALVLGVAAAVCAKITP
jgi:hypothetical protein